MSRPYRLAVVIPARDEELRLPATLRDIAATRLADVTLVDLVIALNGPFRDRTAEVAHRLAGELGLPLRIERLAVPGKAGALVATMLPLAQADVDGVLFMDADNATRLEELRRFDLRGVHDLIQIASVRQPGARVIALKGSGPIRRLLSRAAALWTRLVLGLPERDTQRGFKLFPRATISPLFGRLVTRSWMFDAEILARAHRAGFRVRELPVTWTEMPGSKVNPLRDGLISAVEVLRIRRTLMLEARA